MKKVIYLLSAVLIIGLSVIGCEIWEQSVTGDIVSYSDCKSSKSSVVADDTSDTLSCISYFYDAYKKKLSLTHINAGFNCCPGKLSCRVSMDGNVIVIKERERSSLCNCNCLFDLEIEIEGLDAKTYQVQFEEPYCGDQEQLIFEVDLENCPEGSYCVTRKDYPWGMSQWR